MFVGMIAEKAMLADARSASRHHVDECGDGERRPREKQEEQADTNRKRPAGCRVGG